MHFNQNIYCKLKRGTAFAFLVVKAIVMKTAVLIKEIYAEAFKNLGHYMVKYTLKIFTWFSFALFLVGLYALIFRMSTGFAFD